MGAGVWSKREDALQMIDESGLSDTLRHVLRTEVLQAAPAHAAAAATSTRRSNVALLVGSRALQRHFGDEYVQHRGQGEKWTDFTAASADYDVIMHIHTFLECWLQIVK